MIKLGQLIDERYRINARIGSGGMAEVYEANDIITRKIIAFKILKEEVANKANIARFEHEARAVAALNHPNIVLLLNTGTYEGLPYIINEYIKGQTLRDVLDFRGALPQDEVCDIMLQLTSAVEHAHSRGVLHCDIKSTNVFLEPDGTVKLADFGLAIIGREKESQKKDKTIAGSVHYLAPELSKGIRPSKQSDIYALGVLFFELMTSKLPFEEATKYDTALAHVRKAFPSLHKYLPNANKSLERIILKATRKNPYERYTSVQDMHDDIQKVVDAKQVKKKKTILERLFGFKSED